MKDRPSSQTTSTPISSNGSRRSWLQRLNRLISNEPHDRESLIELLRESEERNILDPDSLAMIEGALLVSELQVRDIMIPRIQISVVREDDDLGNILASVIESGHSRFPVIGDDSNEVVGILLAKDLLAYTADQDNTSFAIKDIMRPAVFVPESKRLNVLLREFRASKNHMAIVVDEYSNVAGLITIEDVIEEIVGNIEDEHDIDEEDYIRQHGHNRYTVQAMTPIEEFNEYFETDFSDDEYDTIGGLILNAFGHLPQRGETIDYGGFSIKVLRADRRRIHLLRVIQQEQLAADVAPDGDEQ
ncbi:magnesium and cobalt transporter [Methylohalomonas lacus]|uniref:Magnesium and cobalt efflux protein CorC n=1 Tax=Methylohalomonas lacus TaxID=398773 RepID=A0AAE3HMY8_9GAMM|nr:transporter associated domain-containing protein [Methylohalomonas lacus]MCS3904124.1 magnesium and cobalt transporter [Methylohalomonas lacus]